MCSAPSGRTAATREVLLASGFRAYATERGRDRTGNNTEPVYGGLSLLFNGVPHLLAAGTHGGVVSQHTGRDAQTMSATGTPLVRASALHGVSPTEILGRGSHLGSTLNPGGAVLTGGVFRRAGSVACIRADASPSEVLAPAMVNDNSRAVKLVYIFDPRIQTSERANHPGVAGVMEPDVRHSDLRP